MLKPSHNDEAYKGTNSPLSQHCKFLYRICSQEAQRCYCGAENCRGWLSGEKKFKADFEDDYEEEEEKKRRKKREKRKKRIFDDIYLEEEIEKMLQLDGMKRKEHVLELARLMVRSDSSKQRLTLLKVLQVIYILLGSLRHVLMLGG